MNRKGQETLLSKNLVVMILAAVSIFIALGFLAMYLIPKLFRPFS
jgi:mannitol-specific phosphotransferase system IIBC component